MGATTNVASQMAMHGGGTLCTTMRRKNGSNLVHVAGGALATESNVSTGEATGAATTPNNEASHLVGAARSPNNGLHREWYSFYGVYRPSCGYN
jgi:hypothetical protein